MSASPVLFNQLLGEDRSLAGPEAGLTRDAITAPWKAGERDVLLHDTAGLRKKARVAGETLEEMSVASTLEAIRFADCVIVMIDATAPFEKQDLTIADLIAREGRAIVFAINKWDLLENKAGAISRMREKLDRLLPQMAGAPLIATSARTGEGIERLEGAVTEADTAWNSRVSTATLNRFLKEALQRHATPGDQRTAGAHPLHDPAQGAPASLSLCSATSSTPCPRLICAICPNGLRENFNLKRHAAALFGAQQQEPVRHDENKLTAWKLIDRSRLRS